MKFYVLVTLLFLACNSNEKGTLDKEATFSGSVVKIIDGDTYDILLSNNSTERVRMLGIDAPERKMPFYQVSKDYLGKLCYDKTIMVVQTGKDRYGRVLAKSYDGEGHELGLLMIAAGYAWHFKRYSTDVALEAAEQEARKKHLGLWADESPIPPWEMRQWKREK
jgi:micrococcal nuclease